MRRAVAGSSTSITSSVEGSTHVPPIRSRWSRARKAFSRSGCSTVPPRTSGRAPWRSAGSPAIVAPRVTPRKEVTAQEASFGGTSRSSHTAGARRRGTARLVRTFASGGTSAGGGETRKRLRRGEWRTLSRSLGEGAPVPRKQQTRKTPDGRGSRARPHRVLEFPSLRRLFSELFGTFLLVLAGAGGAVVGALGGRRDQQDSGRDRARADGDGRHPLHGRGLGRTPESGRLARVRHARGLSVAAGARLRPRAARRRPARVPLPVGALGKVGDLGATEPGVGIADWQALLTELALTVGLVSTILGTASKAQNVGRCRPSRSAATSSSPASGRAPSAARR